MSHPAPGILCCPGAIFNGKPRAHLDAKTTGTLKKDQGYSLIKVCRKTEPAQIFKEFHETRNR